MQITLLPNRSWSCLYPAFSFTGQITFASVLRIYVYLCTYFHIPKLRYDIMIRYRDLRKGARLFYLIKQLKHIQLRMSIRTIAYKLAAYSRRAPVTCNVSFLLSGSLSVCQSVSLSSCTSASFAWRIYINFVLGDFGKNPSRYSKFGQNWAKILETLH
jgi:hypothetical protein